MSWEFRSNEICIIRTSRNRLYHSPFRLYPIKRTDNAESASSPSNYIPRTQSHLNFAEFGGDKHGAHVPGSHSPGEERFVAYRRYSREDNFRRFNIALNDVDLTMEDSEYWLLSPARPAQRTRHTLLRTINRRLRNRNWQERNRVYVEPMYIILMGLRVHLRIEKEDKERTKRGIEKERECYWWEEKWILKRRNI